MGEKGQPAETSPKQARRFKKPDVPTNFKLVQTLTGHTRAAVCVQFSPDEATLASASGDQTCKLWDSKTGELLRTLEGHSKGLSAVCWSPCSKAVCTASDDKTLRIWRVDTGTSKQLIGHTHYVFCCTYSPKGNLVASGGFDENVRVWDVQNGICIRTIPAHSDPVTAVDFNPDGTVIVSCSYDGLCRLWNMEDGACLATMMDKDNPPVSFVKFSPNGLFLLTGTLDNQLGLWSIKKQLRNKQYKGHKNESHCLFAAFMPHPNGAYVISGSEDGSIFVWSLNSREKLQVIPASKSPEGEGHCATVMCISALRSGTFASCAMEGDGTVKIWRDNNLTQLAGNSTPSKAPAQESLQPPMPA